MDANIQATLQAAESKIYELRERERKAYAELDATKSRFKKDLGQILEKVQGLSVELSKGNVTTRAVFQNLYIILIYTINYSYIYL